MHDYFHDDTLLAAVWRRDDANRLLLYTSAREPSVHERYLGVRSVLRPTAIGLRIASEPHWDSLSAWLDGVDEGAREHRSAP